MSQQLTLQLNIKTLLLTMLGLMAVVPATMFLTLALLAPRTAHADSTQTSNANPSYQLPAGYVVAPAGACPANGGSAAGTVTVPVAWATVLPTTYTNTTTQTNTETNNTTNTTNTSSVITTTSTTDSNNGNNSNNTADSNNGNGSGNTTNTTTSAVSSTTTNSNNTSNSNNTDSVSNSDNSTNTVNPTP